MTRGLAGDEDAKCSCATVHRLMLLAGRDLDAFPGAGDELMVLDLHGQFTLEDVEELPGALVMVACFAGAWGHQLVDDVEFGRADDIPAVTVAVVRTAPFVVLGAC